MDHPHEHTITDPPHEDTTMDPNEDESPPTGGIINPDRPSTAPGRMLCDLIRNCQVLSAELPPDDWDDRASPPLIERKRSGTLSLNTPDPSTRRVVSAPVASPPRPGPSRWKPSQPRYYSMNNASQPSDNEATGPSTSVRDPYIMVAPSDKSVAKPPPPNDEERYRLAQDGPYPSMASSNRPTASSGPAPPSSSVHPALRGQGIARAPMAGLNVPRTRTPIRQEGSEDPLLPRGGSFTHTNGVHLPSPLRNVSLPGDGFEDIELLPRGMPQQAHQHPGPTPKQKKSWFRKWFLCGRSRK